MNDLKSSRIWYLRVVWAEWAVFIMICLIMTWFHCVLYQHSGGFWRDETNSIQVARQSSLFEQLRWLNMDSFPALLSLLLRAWIQIWAGQSENGIRLFGIFAGLALMLAIGLSGWIVSRRAPLIALALGVVNPNVFYIASSIRAYGISASFIVLCAASFWMLAMRYSRSRLIVALIFAVLAAHSTYQNTFLIFSIGISAAIICAERKLWNRAAIILFIGFLTAVSMLVYVPVIGEYRSDTLIQIKTVSLGMILHEFLKAIAGDNIVRTWIWSIFILNSLIGFLLRFGSIRPPHRTDDERQLLMFTWVGIISSILTGCVFHISSGRHPCAWHFVPLIAFLGIMIDARWSSQRQPIASGICRIFICILILSLSFADILKQSLQRRTNVDLVCQTIVERARPDDFIMVTPFYLSPAFSHYYKGETPWNTLPEIRISESRSRWGPFPEIKRLMETPNAIEPTLQTISRVLSEGKRLWIVGGLEVPPENEPIPDLPAAPNSPHGWNSGFYNTNWSMRAVELMQRHALSLEVIRVSKHLSVSPAEDLLLIKIEGWHD